MRKRELIKENERLTQELVEIRNDIFKVKLKLSECAAIRPTERCGPYGVIEHTYPPLAVCFENFMNLCEDKISKLESRLQKPEDTKTNKFQVYLRNGTVNISVSEEFPIDSVSRNNGFIVCENGTSLRMGDVVAIIPVKEGGK